jgi:hypothetical protein
MAADRGRLRRGRVSEVIGLVGTHQASGCGTVVCREQDGVKTGSDRF